MTISTLRLTITPVTHPGSAGEGSELRWRVVGLDDTEFGVLRMVRIEHVWHGPEVVDGVWGTASGLERRELGSRLQEAALTVVEACLDHTDWQEPIGLRRQPHDPRADRWSVDPARIGFQRVWQAQRDDVWRFRPGRDAFAARGIITAISGGGLRATGFALGVFRVFDELGLWPRLRAVTSVSGGSLFTGVWMAVRARRGPDVDFDEISDAITEFVTGIPGLERPAGEVHPSLIGRFADLTAAKLFADEDGAPLRLGALPSEPEVLFQAAELSRGGSFVLASTDNNRLRQGAPPWLRVPASVWREVRLADAVSASAAFPVGFEPLVFPRDFDLPSAARKDLAEPLRKADASAGIGLVDGGVFDNQGIRAALTAVRRHPTADMLVVVDVDQGIGKPPLVPNQLLLPSPWFVLGLWMVGALAVVGAWFLTPWLLGLLVVLALAVPPVVLWLGGRRLPDGLHALDFAIPTRFLHAARVRIRVAVVLLSQVFMRQIRRLSYADLYARDERRQVHPAPIQIGDLLEVTEAGAHTLLGALGARYRVSDSRLQSAIAAMRVGTTLRLPGDEATRQQTAQHLTEAGRTTAILRLLFFLHRVPRPRTREVRGMLRRLEELWSEG